MNFTKFEETKQEWLEVNKRLYEESKQVLLNVLENTPNNHIELDDERMICVPYDGGKHPEYDSNLYSMVSCVYLKDGKIYLEIEECIDYSIDNIDASSLCDVAECCIGQYEQDFEEE